MRPGLANILLSGGRNRWIFGVSWTAGTTDPALTRTHAAVGKVANAGLDASTPQNDFDALPIWGEIREVTDDLGNAFVRIPKFYIRKTATSIQVSKTQYPGFYLPCVFRDFATGRELPFYDHGKHVASLDGTVLASKPGVYPLISKTIVDFRTYARANNAGGRAGYQQLDVHAQDALQTLFALEFATFDSQSVMQGFSTGQYVASHVATATEAAANRIVVANATAALYRVGQAISVGTSLGGNQRFYGRTITAIEVYDASNKAIVFDGAPVAITAGDILYNTGWKTGFSGAIAAKSGSIVANDGKFPCCYRGIESPWADVWQSVDGLNINEYQSWVCQDAASYQSNLFFAPYEQLSYVNHNADGYAVELGLDPDRPFAQLATAVNASSAAARYRDYYYRQTGQRIARVGGDWRNGSNVGLWCWYLYSASSDASVSVGGRLLKKAL